MNKFALGITLGVFVFSSVSAWVLPNEMRAAAVSAVAAAMIMTTGPIVSNAIDFAGAYSDPNHPFCKREIFVVDRETVKVRGTDGNPGCPPDGSGTPWELMGRIHGNSILVDFTPKGGPKDLKGIYNDQTSPESIK